MNNKSFNDQNLKKSSKKARLGLSFIFIGIIWLLIVALDLQNRDAWTDLTIQGGAIIFVPPIFTIALGISFRNNS